MEKKQIDKNRKFSFANADKFGVDQYGNRIVIDRYDYKILDAMGVGMIIFTPRDGKYWLGEGAECPKDVLESKYLPYLRWKYDNFVTQEIFEEYEEIVTDKHGKEKIETKKRSKGFARVNKFPCSPENIQLKRQELLKEMLERDGDIDKKAIESLTSPTSIESTDGVQLEIKNRSPYMTEYTRIKHMMRV